MPKKQKSNRGGARPGAGRPTILVNREDHQVSLDRETVETMTDIGGGKLSAGIRRAGRIIRELMSDDDLLPQILEKLEERIGIG